MVFMLQCQWSKKHSCHEGVEMNVLTNASDVFVLTLVSNLFNVYTLFDEYTLGILHDS